jgi:hypothetical protein
MFFFMPLTYDFTGAKGLRARLGSEMSGVQIPIKATHFFSNCLSQINIELNISVAISLLTNLLQFKR